MIVRTWKARATAEREASYLAQVRDVVLPHLRAFAGYRGARFATRRSGDELEILVLTFWESESALRAFAGPDPAHAYVPPQIAANLTDWDATSEHFDVRIEDV